MRNGERGLPRGNKPARTCSPLASCARGSYINRFAGMQMQRVRRCQGASVRWAILAILFPTAP